MIRFLRFAGAAAVAGLLIAACSSGSSTTPSASTSSATGNSAASAATITIQNFAFGAPITVPPGATVTVTNKDAVDHNVVSDDQGKFRTTAVHQNESTTFTAPTTSGTYKFSCTFHPKMKGIGTLIVSG